MCALILPCCDFASTEEMIVVSILCKETRRGGLFLICKSEGNPSELVAIYYPGNKLF